MSKSIDCLLIGYLGYSYSLVNKKLINHGYGNQLMEKDFNAAVAYLATFLTKRDISFDYINYIEDEEDVLIRKLQTCDIKVIALSTTYCTNMEETKNLIRFLHKHNPNKQAKILVGGAYIAKLFGDPDLQDINVLQHILKKLDSDIYINSFQGEYTLAQAIQSIKNNTPMQDVPNLYFRDGRKYIPTKVVLEDNKLEDNTVQWDMFSDDIGSIVPVRFSISCPFSCSYCAYHINAGKFRCVDVSCIERELNIIDNIKQVKTIHFVDDTLNVPQERFKEILRMMIRNQYHFNWCSFIRCQFLDEETTRLMKESKCVGTFLGIESGNPEILVNMNKRASVADIKRGNELMEKHGINRFASFIVGFPGETDDTIQDTISFIKDLKLKYFGAATWYYDPRTPIHLYEERFDIKGSHYDWSHATMDVKTALEKTKYVQSSIETAEHFVYDPTWLFNLLDAKQDYRDIKPLLPEDRTILNYHPDI